MNTPTPLEKRIAALSSIADPDKRFEALLADFERIESEKSALESSLKTITDLAIGKVTAAYPEVVQAAVDAALVEPNRKIEILATALRKIYPALSGMPTIGADILEALKQANLEQTT